MDIIAHCEKIQTEFKGTLMQLVSEPTSLQHRAVKAMSYVHEVLANIRAVVKSNRFSSVDEEIQFFKSYKPTFASQYLYYDKLLALSFNTPASLEDAHAFFYHELNAIRNRFVEHRDFYQYCLSGATHLDKHYFLRAEAHHLNINLDPDFSTGYDMVLAAILADSLLREHLLEKLGRSQDDMTTKSIKLSWTASKADLVELIYALHQAGSINGGNADIGQIASTFESIFNIELGNYYRTYTDIRMRKKNVAVFLEKLQNDFMRKVNDADN